MLNKKILLGFSAQSKSRISMRVKILRIFPAVLIFTFFSTAALAQTTDGLIGYWKFDGNGNNEVSGGTAAATVGSAEFKSSGGKDGGYLYVNTSSDWGKIPYSSTFDLANSFTIEFWFRQRANQSFTQNLVYKGNGQNNYNFLINRWLWNEYNEGPVIAGSTAVNTGYWSQVSNGNQLSHGSWHHVVYSRNTSYAVYYLDGVRWNEQDWNVRTEYSGSVKTPAVDIIIGDSAVDTDFDNLRIYNRVLSYLEVTQNGGFPAPTTTTTTTVPPTTTTSPPNQTNVTTTTSSNMTGITTTTFYTATTTPSNQTTTTTITTTGVTTTAAQTTATTMQGTTTAPQKSAACTDTDRGFSIYQAGAVTDQTGKVYADSCTDNSTLTEYYCAESSVLSNTSTCSYGCISDRCKSFFENLIESLINLIKSIFGAK